MDFDDFSYAEFTPADFEAWRQAAVGSLSGKPFESLVTTTYEGIDIQPLYRREDLRHISALDTLPGSPPFVRGSRPDGYLTRPWWIAQELAYGTPEELNHALLYDLEHGQTAVNLLLDGPTRAGKDPDQARPGEVGYGGVSLATVDDVATVLRGIDLSQTPLSVRVGTVALPFLALLAAYQRRAGRPHSDLRGCLEDDPLGVLAHEGTLPLSMARALDEMAQLTVWAASHAPGLRTVAVHSYPYHNAGADAVQELAYAVSAGVSYVRALTERGLDVNTIARHIRFDLAVGGNFFMEIAKLRAARVLWARVIAAFGGDVDAQSLTLHARTSRRNKTMTDPYVNMLRVTTEALAAALGGVDSLHVAPFDEAMRPPDAFSRRIARNVQAILQSEAHLTQVIDPAGGAYYAEILTDELARRAWTLFQDIERQGGMAAALESGFVQAGIDRTYRERSANLATRQEILVGTNQFVNAVEQEPPVDGTSYEAIYRERTARMVKYRTHDDDPRAHSAALDSLARMLSARPEELVEAAIAAAAAGASLNEITRTLRVNESARPTIVPVSPSRAAEPFEALRQRAREYAGRHGAPPRVFLANMGPLRQHKARADFAQALLEAGGFEVLTNSGFPTPLAAAEAALASGAPAVAVCSTDESYPDIVPALAGALRSVAPAIHIILAGRPVEQLEAHKAAGVEQFIYLGMDSVRFLEWLHEVCRVKQPDGLPSRSFTTNLDNSDDD